MVKIAQHTRFDEDVQDKVPSYYNQPRQRLLFPKPPANEWNSPITEEEIPDPELNKPRVELDLDYPELGPEHIKTQITSDLPKAINRYRYRYDTPPATPIVPVDTENVITEEEDYDGYDPENARDTSEETARLNRVVKMKILAKYNKLRATAITFYTYYQEANALAAADDYEIDLSGTYADLFSNYGKLITHKLTQEIGRLFGSSSGSRYRYGNSIKYMMERGINIFNITDENYQSKINELDTYINNMNNIIKDYEKRIKLLKYIGPKIQEEADRVLQQPDVIKFCTWMDTYFPNYKAELVQDAMQAIEKRSPAKHTSGIITFGDLVNFKTYKSIYEKAQVATTKTFKSNIEYKIHKDMEHAVRDELYERISRVFISLANYVSNRDKDLSAEEQCNQIILFLRKNLNLDVRSIFTFSLSVNKKSINTYYESVPVPEGKDPEVHKQDMIYQAKQDSESLYMYFVNRLDHFIKNFLEKNIKDDWVAKWGLKSSVEQLVTKLVGYKSTINQEEYAKLLEYNSRDFDKMAGQFVYTFILQSIRGLTVSDSRHKEPALGGISEIISHSDGKFSIEAFTNYAHQHAPFVPKEILFASIKAMFRELDHSSLNNFNRLNFASYQVMTHVIVELLKRDNKLNHDNFYKLFKNITFYAKIHEQLAANFPKSFNDDEVFKLIIEGIRSSQTMEQDLNNLVVFAKFIHNEAGDLSDEIVRKIIQNKNFINFNKVGIVKKVFKCYTQIKNEMGVKGIYAKYGKLIAQLRERKYISTNFRENLFLITKFFESNEEINPSSPIFSQLFEVSSQIESDLSILEMGEALKDLLKGYKTKSPALFDLDYPLRNDLRFKVLKDKDPRILRIGIETDCCQRLGGVGEIAARDSFMNPLSSVLVLEWKDPKENDWKLLTQSYFHYVPQDNGYILDNVEHNNKNVRTFKEQNPDVSLEDVYAVYANEIKNKLDVSYFLSGKGYSKIDSHKFNTDVRDTDPRFLDDRALTKYKRDHYSDYEERNGMNLLSPNFDIDNARNKVFAPEMKKARLQMRKFIKSILHPIGFKKFAQATSTSTQPVAAIPATPPPSPQDIKTLPGIDIKLFGPQSWNFINQFMNILNNGLFELGQGKKLGNQTVNFQTVTKNPTGLTSFSGGLKGLFKISTRLWEIVTADKNQIYTVDESKNIINDLKNQINTSDFPEPAAQSLKPKMIAVLNNWSGILQ